MCLPWLFPPFHCFRWHDFHILIFCIHEFMRLECDLGPNPFLAGAVLSPSVAAFSWFLCLESQVLLHSWRESFLSTSGAGDPWTLGLCFNQIENLMFHHLYHSLSYPLLQIHCHLQFLYASSSCGLVWFWCFWIQKA